VLTLIDSHCHPQLPVYDDCREAMIEAVQKKNIGMVAIGTNYATSFAAIALAEKYSAGVWASAGIHPCHVFSPHFDSQETSEPPSEEFFDEEKFSQMIKSKKLVAIGEVGLDYYRLEAADCLAATRQKENLIAHLLFAAENNLPLTFHLRDKGDGSAYRDFFQIIDEPRFRGRVRGALHCFGGGLNEARAATERGLYLGFGGIVTFPPKKNELENSLWPIIRATAIDRLLLETDAPYLSPAPERGKRNTPDKVAVVAAVIAEILGISTGDLSHKTTENAARLYNLADETLS
jgi:TatD DNase family protein